MNATPLKCSTKIFNILRNILVLAFLGTFIYALIEHGKYTCEYCGEKSWGNPCHRNISEWYGERGQHRRMVEKEICPRCDTLFKIWDRAVDIQESAWNDRVRS